MRATYEYKFFGSLRTLLALFVLYEHFVPAVGPQSWWDHFLPMGVIGVLLFFVISGFVITEASHVFYSGRPGAFIQNRLMRIFPPYFFALALSLAGVFFLGFLGRHGHVLNPSAVNDSFFLKHQKSILLSNFLNNLIAPFDFRVVLMRETYPLAVRYIWAIVVELQFYFLMAGTMLLAKKFGANVFKVVIIATGLISWCYCFFSYGPFLPAETSSRAAWFLLRFIPYFLFGALLYTGKLPENKGNYLLKIWMGFVLFLMVIDFANNVKGHQIMTGIFISLIVLFQFLSGASLSGILGKAAKALDSRLGDLSYPLYLNHYIVEMATAALLPRGILAFAIGVIGSVLVSALALMCVEPLTKKIRVRIRGRTLD